CVAELIPMSGLKSQIGHAQGACGSATSALTSESVPPASLEPASERVFPRGHSFPLKSRADSHTEHRRMKSQLHPLPRSMPAPVLPENRSYARGGTLHRLRRIP